MIVVGAKIIVMDAKTKKTVIDLAKVVIIFDIVASIVIFLFAEDITGRKAIPLLLGFDFGSLITLLMFLELALTLEKAVKMEKDRANAYTAGKYYFRVLIYGIVIFISIKADYIDVIGTVVGLLSVKVIIYIKHIIFKKNS